MSLLADVAGRKFGGDGCAENCGDQAGEGKEDHEDVEER